jgi:hypothetical protein
MRPYLTAGLSRARPADGWRGTGSLFRRPQDPLGRVQEFVDDNNHIDFNALATLRKWPSIRNERASTADGPYLIVDGTLDDCIRQFMGKPTSQPHLYEIHTAPQGELGSVPN